MKITSNLGNAAEQFVAQHLQQQGFTIVASNYTQRYGEIDIIARHKQQLCFVEVKCRVTDYFDMAELVSYSKQQKIIKTAQHYVMTTKQEDMQCQFDVALVHCKPDNNWQLTYIPHAFTLTD